MDCYHEWTRPTQSIESFRRHSRIVFSELLVIYQTVRSCEDTIQPKQRDTILPAVDMISNI